MAVCPQKHILVLLVLLLDLKCYVMEVDRYGSLSSFHLLWDFKEILLCFVPPLT